MLRRIAVDTDEVQFLANIEGRLQYKELYLVIEGTNEAAATMTADNIGRMYLLGRGGEPLIAIDFVAQQALNDIEGGNAEQTSALGAAFRFDCIIPRSYGGDHNVELVEPDDNLLFRIDFLAAFATNAATATITLYALVDQGVTRYQLTEIQQAYTIGAAGVFKRAFLSEDLVKVYLSDMVADCFTLAASTIDHITTKVGMRSGDCAVADAIGYTNCKKMLEAQTQLAALIFAAEGDLSSALDDKIDIGFTTTAAAVPQVILCGAKFNPEKLGMTAVDSDNRIVQVIDRARSEGRVRKAAVIEAVAGAEVPKR